MRSDTGSCQAPAWPSVGIHQGLDKVDDGGSKNADMYQCHICDR